LGEPAAAGNWSVGAGPAIRLIRGREDRIQEIVLAVKSLDSAKTFLARSNSLGSATAGQIVLNPPNIQGLKIRLVR
jgi:hypothetical protein